MRQHAIDLMPAEIRARSLAGARAGRFFAVSGIAMLILVMIATHSRLELNSAQQNLAVARAEAEAVYTVDAHAAELKGQLKQAEEFIELYRRVSFPVDVGAVIATLIDALPDSVTLDQLDIDAGSKAISRSPRAKGAEPKDEVAPRVLMCELSGFAASDEHIAELVSRLDSTAPFRNVSLDFSRTKRVNERDAREFRLSFRIDLNANYTVSYRETDQFPESGKEGLANAQ